VLVSMLYVLVSMSYPVSGFVFISLEIIVILSHTYMDENETFLFF